MAVGAIVVVAMAVLAAVTLLPALIARARAPRVRAGQDHRPPAVPPQDAAHRPGLLGALDGDADASPAAVRASAATALMLLIASPALFAQGGHRRDRDVPGGLRDPRRLRARERRARPRRARARPAARRLRARRGGRRRRRPLRPGRPGPAERGRRGGARRLERRDEGAGRGHPDRGARERRDDRAGRPAARDRGSGGLGAQRGRRDGAEPGRHRPDRRLALEGRGVRAHPELPGAAGRAAQRDPAAEGRADERAVGGGRVRRARGRLPVGLVRRDHRLRVARLRAGDHARTAARDRVRPVDGLRGLHALAHQGALPGHRRHADRRSPRASGRARRRSRAPR